MKPADNAGGGADLVHGAMLRRHVADDLRTRPYLAAGDVPKHRSHTLLYAIRVCPFRTENIALL